MDPKWFPPSDRPVLQGIPIYLGPYVIGITSLLLPQGRVRVLAAVPPLLYIIYILRKYSSGKIEADYMYGVNVGCTIFKWIDLMILRTPEKEMRRIRDDGSVETVKDIENMSVWQKLRWNFWLYSTLRGIGWNWRVNNIKDVPKDTSRRQFIARQLFGFAYCYLIIDFLEWIRHRSRFGNPEPGVDFFSLPVWHQMLITWTNMFYTGYTLAFPHYIMATISVGLGLNKPQEWPPLFGYYSNAYTIRNVWGRCWHQNLRRIFETANAKTMAVLKIPKGTILSRYLQLYLAFFISGLIHHFGALNRPYIPAVEHQALFFMLQPIAITIEDVAIYLGKRVNIRKSWKTKAIGFVWVFSVLSLTGRIVVRYSIDSGLNSVKHPLHLGLVKRILG